MTLVANGWSELREFNVRFAGFFHRRRAADHRYANASTGTGFPRETRPFDVSARRPHGKT